ncbi:hypothetical protein HY624_00835 [Candidatus Uhrbacteria bacterium]|nr:hypothetical protein [Candidatus Uhrbacteria bacterium]
MKKKEVTTVEVKRKRNESFESLLRRFNRRMLMSGRALQAKKIRFFRRPKNETKKRAGALRRVVLQKRAAYLERIGKLDDMMK